MVSPLVRKLIVASVWASVLIITISMVFRRKHVPVTQPSFPGKKKDMKVSLPVSPPKVESKPIIMEEDNHQRESQDDVKVKPPDSLNIAKVEPPRKETPVEPPKKEPPVEPPKKETPEEPPKKETPPPQTTIEVTKKTDDLTTNKPQVEPLSAKLKSDIKGPTHQEDDEKAPKSDNRAAAEMNKPEPPKSEMQSSVKPVSDRNQHDESKSTNPNIENKPSVEKGGSPSEQTEHMKTVKEEQKILKLPTEGSEKDSQKPPEKIQVIQKPEDTVAGKDISDKSNEPPSTSQLKESTPKVQPQEARTSKPIEYHMTKSEWVNVFDFLPYGVPGCAELPKINLTAMGMPFKNAVQKHKEALLDYLNEHEAGMVEGNSGEIQEQLSLYWRLANLPFVKTICETGFNAGHSSVVWLAADEDNKVYSFDLKQHDYAAAMADYLKEEYPGRLTVTWGDSTQTLPKFREDHPEVKCDLIIIDGGLTTNVVTADFDNFRRMANKWHIIVLDDYPSHHADNVQQLGAMWEKKKRIGELHEIFGCSFGNHRGFSIGQYAL